MLKKIAVGAILVSLILIVVACAGPSSSTPTPTPAPTTPKPVPAPAPTPTPTPTPAKKPSGPITAEWIEPQVSGDTVSIPVGEVEGYWNTHFKLEMKGKEMNFMAYILDGKVHVRANVCPPCRSIGFSLSEDILVCDRCATTFEAETGDGIQGACVNYPKASVSYEIADDKIVMKEGDLIAAYDETLRRG